MVSGTNLLTRCHSASYLFFAVFGFRKVVLEIFSKLDTAKTKIPIFPEVHKVRWGVGDGHQGGLARPRRGPTLAAPRGGEGAPVAP